MTRAIGERAIDFALQSSPASLCVGFFGGEPLLRFELLKHLSEYARAKAAATTRVAFHLTTNGDVLSGGIADFLRSQRFDVALSAHDPSMRAVRRPLGLLLAAGLEPHVVLVADPTSAVGLTRNVKALLAEGVREIGISPDYYADWDERSRSRLAAAYHGLAALYRRSIAGRARHRLSLFDMRLATLRTGTALRDTHCGLGREQIVVAPDGTVFPCDRMAVDTSGVGTAVGTLTGVDEERWERLVDECARTPQQCRECRYRSICTHFCACVNIRLTGRASVVPEVVCWHESMLGQIVYALAAELDGLRLPVRQRRRLVRVTAGLAVAAGALSLSCRDERPANTGPDQAASSQAAEPPATAPAITESQPAEESWIACPVEGKLFFADEDGVRGTVRLRLLSDLAADRLEGLLGEHEEEVARVVREELARVKLASLSEPENEMAMGQRLLKVLGVALGEESRLRGIRLDVSAAELIPEDVLESLRSLGYVGP